MSKRITLSGLIAATLLAQVAVAQTPTNVALNKKADQSSRSQWSKPNDPQGAVDGIINGSFGFHTNQEPNAWWQVDLGQPYSLTELVVYNRLDCCSERSVHLTALLSNDGQSWREVYVHSGPPFGGRKNGPLKVGLKGEVARWVRLMLKDNQPLHLDEVEVMGVPPPPTNLALGKPTQTSSRSQWSKPNDGNGAVDGIINGSFGFHTNQEWNPWWQVDLGAMASVNELVIYNRRDCCAERSAKLIALISDDGASWREVYAHTGAPFGGNDGRPLRVPVNLPARFVRLQLKDNQPLHLDEVQVMGTLGDRQTLGLNGGRATPEVRYQTPEARFQTPEVRFSQPDAPNIALGKPTQTSSRSQWSKRNDGNGAVDGVINGSFGFHTNQQQDPWWQVDLGTKQPVAEVVVYNRQDCCAERSQHLVGLISDDGASWSEVYAHQGAPFGGFKDGRPLRFPVRRPARFVRLMLRDNQPLHLDEVQVMGGGWKKEMVREQPVPVPVPVPMPAPAPVPVPTPAPSNLETVNAGPIWDNGDAARKCPGACGSRRWNGQWWTTQQNVMSVCQCETTTAAVAPTPVPVPVPVPAPAPAPVPAAPAAMSDEDFSEIIGAIKAEAFSKNKLDALTMAAQGKNFSIAQVGTLVDQFSFSSDKLNAVKAVKSQIIDPQNSFKLLTHFTFSSDKDAIRKMFK